jgi:hypothetical protein
MMDNLDKDKMTHKYNTELNTHNKTKKNMREVMANLEKCSLNLKNLEQD